MKEYYDARAPEYDEWYYGEGRWVGVERPGWEEELEAVRAALSSLPAARTLDVACGTAYLSQHLHGEIVALDQSEAMLAKAAERLPGSELVQGDALAGLPFDDGAFERVFAGHYYGHLEPEDAERFVAEARRVAGELVLLDASRRNADVDEEWQERVLNDGTRWSVFKRYFTGRPLAQELGGGDVLHEGRWFVVVRS